MLDVDLPENSLLSCYSHLRMSEGHDPRFFQLETLVIMILMIKMMVVMIMMIAKSLIITFMFVVLVFKSEGILVELISYHHRN